MYMYIYIYILLRYIFSNKYSYIFMYREICWYISIYTCILYLCIFTYIYIYCICIFAHILHTYMHIYIRYLSSMHASWYPILPSQGPAAFGARGGRQRSGGLCHETRRPHRRWNGGLCCAGGRSTCCAVADMVIGWTFSWTNSQTSEKSRSVWKRFISH